MNPLAAAAAAFGAGILAQALLLAFSERLERDKLLLFFGIFFGCLLGLFSAKPDSFYVCLLGAYGFFALLFACMFYGEILPTISEETLLSETLVFWFACFGVLSVKPWGAPAMLLAAVPSLGVLVLAVVDMPLGFPGKLAAYIWHLVVATVIGLLQFRGGDAAFFLGDAPPADLLGTFFSGMILLFILVHLSFLYLLLPIPGKHQSMEARLRELTEYARTLAGKYSDVQLRPGRAAFILLVQGGFLWLNRRSQWVDQSILLSALFLGVPQCHSYLNRRGK